MLLLRPVRLLLGVQHSYVCTLDRRAVDDADLASHTVPVPAPCHVAVVASSNLLSTALLEWQGRDCLVLGACTSGNVGRFHCMFQ